MLREQERRIIVAAMRSVAQMRDEGEGGISRRFWSREDRELYEAVYDLESGERPPSDSHD